jgi:peptidylprolyl isomerase
MKIIKILTIILFLVTVVLILGCGTATDTTPDAKIAKIGDTVKVEYTGKLSDGSEFDTSVGREPIKFTLGSDEYLPAFENAILGMSVGQKKTFTIPAEEAYGPHYPEKVVVLPRSELSPDIVPKVGMKLVQKQEDGSDIIATITEVTDDTVTLDANYPLAGKDLTFEVKLLELTKGQ